MKLLTSVHSSKDLFIMQNSPDGPSQNTSMSDTPPPSQTTRILSFVTHAQLVEAYDAYVGEVGKVPRIEIRGSVEFVEPGQRAGTWRKRREIDLPDWYEIREWRREEPLLMIWYCLTGGIYRAAPKSGDQWVRPVSLFDHKWYHLRLLCPLFENTVYLAPPDA